MRGYLAAQAEKQHEKRFGWKTFRVLTVTTDDHRIRSMLEMSRTVRVPHSLGASLFLLRAAPSYCSLTLLDIYGRPGMID